MAIYKYSVKIGEKSAAAQSHDSDASYKDLGEICRALRGKKIPEARKILEEAIAMKRAIPYVRHAGRCGARSELRGQKGRYPKKECRLVRSLLENAVANAKHKGLDEAKLVVSHAAAYKQNEFPRYRRTWAGSNTLGYGKQAIWGNYMTARVEIVVSEK